MHIVVIDGYTLNPGDLSWKQIETIGSLTVYDRTAKEDIVERCLIADIILTNKVPFTKQTLLQLPQLKYIGVLATGYDIIDIDTCRQQNIVVCNVPSYGTASVAQHVFALLLQLTNNVGGHSLSTRNGGWQNSADWCYTLNPIVELSGKTFGIVGFGHIGQQTAHIAHAFGMKVIFYNTSKKESNIAESVGLEDLFSQSDVVSLHCPLTKENHQFVNDTLLKKMKKTSFLINTSRGGLIEENHLASALNRNELAGAGLDVLSKEPPQDNNPLLTAKNCVVTPHNAWMSKEARERMMNIVTKNIQAFIKGSPVNVVNK